MAQMPPEKFPIKTKNYEGWIRTGIFFFGLLVGSFIFPSPHYKTNAPGVVLNTWTGELSQKWEKQTTENPAQKFWDQNTAGSK
jgi:hypothetical protein